MKREIIFRVETGNWGGIFNELFRKTYHPDFLPSIGDTIIYDGKEYVVSKVKREMFPDSVKINFTVILHP